MNMIMVLTVTTDEYSAIWLSASDDCERNGDNGCLAKNNKRLNCYEKECC